ncbi:unnamed protein product [Moneuplotes crassus]|uniref:UDP-glucose 4-epimerase n=1 Tax=Euplotes crassus TaxID=5936 RepID=A0AAD2CXW4_EUPCR|nr:unnamed protein product [Moneuplotes crassus]
MESSDRNILITGGLGYIGSHTVVHFAENRGYSRIIIVDDLSNSSIEVYDKIHQILCDTSIEIIFEEVDCANFNQMDDKVFSKYDIHEIIHFAGSKDVNESFSLPLLYYENNVMSTINLLKLVDKYKGTCKAFIVSSTAAVYSDQEFTEESETEPTNPYSRSKLMIEQILKDYSRCNNRIFCISFRYFNPVGAHPSGMIGENPGKPTNIMPVLQEVATQKRDHIDIYGADYDTEDGTCERDYIHVIDVSNAHLCAMKYISNLTTFKKDENFETINISTGKPTSVLELIRVFEEATGKTLPYKMSDRREGDKAFSKGSTDKAKRLLNFEPKYSLKEACQHSWKWIKGQLEGYSKIDKAVKS